MSEEFYKCKRLHIDAVLCNFVMIGDGICMRRKPPEPFYCSFEERYGDKSAADPANWACNQKDEEEDGSK